MPVISKQVFIFAVASAVLLSCACAFTLAQVSDGLIDQASEDTNNWARSGTINGASGKASRPFVTDFVVTTASGTTTTFMSGLTSPDNSPPSNYANNGPKPMPIVMTQNLCSQGQTGTCYSVPNRVAVSIACVDGNGNRNQSFASAGCDTYIGATYDIKLNLGAFARAVDWTHFNADLQYYDFNEGTKILHAKFKSVTSPAMEVPSGTQCCTCSPPSNCPVQRVHHDRLGAANFLVSVENRDELRGVVFATVGAWLGQLIGERNGRGNGRALRPYLTGAHYKAGTGTELQTAELNVLIPSNALRRAFPQIENDEGGVRRLNISDTNGNLITNRTKVTVVKVDAATRGTAGVWITIRDITFSVQSYGIYDGSGAGMISGIFALAACIVMAMLF